VEDKVNESANDLLKEAGIDEIVCRPDPDTGDLVCPITEEQAQVLEKVSFTPKRVVFEVEAPVVKSKGEGQGNSAPKR